MPAKNTLTAADAQLIEASFRSKLSAFGDEPTGEPSEAAEAREQIAGPNPAATKPSVADPKIPRNGRVRVVTKTIRLRDKDHRKFVSTQPCVVCGRSPADAHHLRFAQPRALGRKVSDEFTVPLCRVHHRELHRHGAETAWCQSIKIDPLPVAKTLWEHTRLDGMTRAETAFAEIDQSRPTTITTGPDPASNMNCLASINAEEGTGR